MRLIEKLTGWYCAHVQITSCPAPISASCSQGCEMVPLMSYRWADDKPDT